MLETVIGVDFGGTKTDVALADSTGRILRRERLATLAALGPDQTLARTAEVVHRLAKTSSDEYRAQVAGWAAVCPGVVQDDRILLTPNLPGWDRLALASRLAEEFGVASVSVANDARAGALAEVGFGELQGVDVGVYVSLGTGIAAALTIGGRVLAGANRAAGEIAYMNPGGEPIGAVAAGRAPLEEIVGGRALERRAASLLGGPVTGVELLRRTDGEARRLVRPALEALAMSLANLSVFVDPERIVIGGGLMAAADVLLPALTGLVASATPFPPEIRAARFLQDASLHGAVALAIDSRGPGRVPTAPATGSDRGRGRDEDEAVGHA